MDDLISRQAAIDAISVYANRYKEHIGKPNDSEVYAYSRGLILSIEMSINALPSAERHGRWVDVEPAPHNLFYATCSVCGDRQTIEVANYCPMCGASMDEVE